MSQTEKTLSEAMKQTDTATEKATRDLKEKKLLVENLSRSRVPGAQQKEFKAREKELKSLLVQMQNDLDTIGASRKKMAIANSEVVSIGYNHSEIKSSQPEYERVTSSVQDFEAAAGEVNAMLEDYAMTSNSFTDVVENNKLLMKFEPGEFVRRVQGSVRTAQETSANMRSELEHADQTIDQTPEQSRVRKAMQKLNSDLHGIAESYTRKAQRFQGIANQVREVTADARITSLDPEWPKIQKLIYEFEVIDIELKQLQNRFFNETESLKNQSSGAAKD
jgi:hypothetical protein